jgi:hypothetical protein
VQDIAQDHRAKDIGRGHCFLAEGLSRVRIRAWSLVALGESPEGTLGR